MKFNLLLHKQWIYFWIFLLNLKWLFTMLEHMILSFFLIIYEFIIIWNYTEFYVRAINLIFTNLRLKFIIIHQVETCRIIYWNNIKTRNYLKLYTIICGSKRENNQFYQIHFFELFSHIACQYKINALILNIYDSNGYWNYIKIHDCVKLYTTLSKSK